MKYMTKEWYEAMQNVSIDADPKLRVSRKAESYCEDYYKYLYKKKEKTWLKDRVNKTKDDFKQDTEWQISLLQSSLPDKILHKVADIRVLALGYASCDVLKDITAFCEECRRIVTSAPRMYQEKHWDFLTAEEKDFFSSSFHDCTVTSCRKRGNDLIISFDNSGGFTNIDNLILKNCVVLKQEQPLHGSWWLYDEVYKTDIGYEIHVLLQSRSKKRELIDFIVSATEVRYKYDKMGVNEYSLIQSMLFKEVKKAIKKYRGYVFCIVNNGFLIYKHALRDPHTQPEYIVFSEDECKCTIEAIKRALDASICKKNKIAEYFRNHKKKSFIKTINMFDDPLGQYHGTINVKYDSDEIFGILIEVNEKSAHECIENRYLEVRACNYEVTLAYHH